MDLMEIRRRIMAGRSVNTTPKIEEYGVYWNRTQGKKSENVKWGTTKWYTFDPLYLGAVTIDGYIGADNTGICFQYEGLRNGNTVWKDWYYFNGQTYRGIGRYDVTLQVISFSIELSKIDDVYAIVRQTGQILFAGKNTPYFGYTNKKDMPNQG